MKDYKSITDKMNLNKTFLDSSCKISFNYFYTNIIPKLKNPESKEKETLETKYDNYIILLRKKSHLFCNVNLLDNGNSTLYERIFMNPIKLYYKLEKMEIAYIEQFENIPELLYIKNPCLYCLNHGETIDYNIKDFLDHLKPRIYGFNQCKIELFDKSINEDSSERKFYQLFQNMKDDDNFETPKSFDINYEYYFDFYKYQINDKNFEFIDDDDTSRDVIIANLCNSKRLLGFYRIYYGKGGIGKSITLIKTFKYNYNHDKFGTLYIQCKCLYNYYLYNFSLMKKILKDEIIFLFKNDYENYKKCCKFIDSSKNNDVFFTLIINIIKKFCNNSSKKYIFIFDQYKSEFDQKGALDELNKTLVKNSKNYGIISCSSMDNKSVRELKIKNLSFNLFEDEISDNHTDNIIIKEVNKLFDVSSLSIDNEDIFDKTLDKIGKNLKNFIALKDFFRRKDYPGMDIYVNELKEKIFENLKDFFKLNKSVKEENDDSTLAHLYNVLSFTVNTEYKLDYIKKIRNYIPFKYFDIELVKNSESENTAKIIFNNELVGEVMNKIYEYIIYENNNIYQIFQNINLDKGALGGLYEKYVIHFMEPDKYKCVRTLFNLFNIREIVTVDKFVPTSREKYFKRKFKIRDLKEGDYLFKQEIFGGKAFDCAIIRIKKNSEAEVFFFQISIYKDTIYSIDELNGFIKTFIDYFSYQFVFSIKQENVYFTYIFHTEKKDELVNECKNNRLKCIFFNPSIQRFTDKNNADLEDINENCNINHIFVNPFEISANEDIEMEEVLQKKKTIKDIMQPNFKLNNAQKNNIEKLWKNLFTEFKNINIKIIYSHNTHFIDEKYLNNKIMYLRKLNNNEIEEWIDAIFEEKYKKDIKKENENNILLIYRERNLSFRLISEEGNICKIKYIPITENIGFKNYDVYIVKTVSNN